MADVQGTAPAGEPKKKGSKLWLILFIVLGLPVIACGGCITCIAGAGFFAVNQIKNSEPYQTALERASSDPEVIESLGQPITGGMPMGEINVEPDSGHANLSFTITGPNGDTARVSTVAEKSGGSWKTTKLTVTFNDDGRTINLMPDGDDSDGGLNIDLGSGG